MVQIKKEAVRNATLKSAFELFKEQGYANTTLKQISEGAGITTTNIYRYYNSKLDVLFAISGPWLNKILNELEVQMTSVEGSHERLRLILYTMWRTIPEKDNGFHCNIIQALSYLKPDEKYSRTLLIELEGRLSELLRTCLPKEKFYLLENNKLAHMLFMGSDGFTIGFGLVGASTRSHDIIEDFCNILLDSKKL